MSILMRHRSEVVFLLVKGPGARPILPNKIMLFVMIPEWYVQALKMGCMVRGH